ncbi:MAG: redoxin domain-containing protein [Balneolaceae bacterium]
MKIGERVNHFTLKNTERKDVSLRNLTADNKTVLLFFPLAFSSVCTEEMCQIRDNMKLYASLNANIAAISVDSFFTLKEFKKANNLNFTLLSDFNREVSAQFNCLYENYFGMKGVAKRSVFVINKEMKIEHSQIMEDSGNIPDFKRVEEALQ